MADAAGADADADAHADAAVARTTWRDAAYVAAIRARCTADQFNRFKRLYREPFFVLESSRPTGSLAASMLVSGSTPTSSYRIRVERASGRVTCSCMDASVNCGRLRCACKHACFAMVRVFRLGDAAVVRWLETLRLTPEDVLAIDERAAAAFVEEDAGADEAAPPDIDALCAELDWAARVTSRPPSHRPAVDFCAIRRPPEAGDECPVCYDELLRAAPGALRGCPDCGKAVHATCASRWLMHAARPTCVYCRSSSWRAYR